jgi:hypothetical protein
MATLSPESRTVPNRRMSNAGAAERRAADANPDDAFHSLSPVTIVIVIVIDEVDASTPTTRTTTTRCLLSDANQAKGAAVCRVPSPLS